MLGSDRAKELLMVGPLTREWKVLRDTDGERFVFKKKAALFKENFASDENKIYAKRYIQPIKTLLDVIIYLLAIELFALRKDRSTRKNGIVFSHENDGPSKIDFGVAKTFSITIMRLPRWKRRLPESESVEVGPDILIVFVGYSLL